MTSSQTLCRGFSAPDAYQSSAYHLLPFRFLRYDSGRYLLTNLVGEYILLGRQDLADLVHHRLGPGSDTYLDLKAGHFIYDTSSDVALELLATKYRTKQDYLKDFTALHMFVVTLRCNNSCGYCQVSRVSEDRLSFDMSPETADKAVGMMFRSPSPRLKVEFQGGEPLLNFGLVRHIVTESKRRNDGRDLAFVIATNLSLITDEILAFCRREGVQISTSLDGPRELHNANRPLLGGDSYERTVSGIRRVREALGPDAVSALMTTTLRSLSMPVEVVDEYVRLGFHSIFVRPMSPYGFAARAADKLGYSAAAFVGFYRRAVGHIVKLNKQGTPMQEEFARIILRKALTPFSTGYVDLQSPAGLGITGIIYNYDGDVYPSDAGRMLAECQDRAFRMGNVAEHTYEQLFVENTLLTTLHETMTEGKPGCCDCAFQPWCGTDPVFHHVTQGDPVGHQPTSDFCRQHMGVFRVLIDIMSNDRESRKTVEGWCQ